MKAFSFVPDTQYRYFYEQLTDNEKVAYDRLLRGYFEQESRITVDTSDTGSVWRIHDCICFDVPELFNVKQVRASADPFSGAITVYPEYRFDGNMQCEMLKSMELATKAFISSAAGLSDKEKVKRVHDYIIRSVVYKDVDAPYSHEAPGTILYGIGVCEGISKAFKYLCDRLGVKSVVAVGKAYGEGIAPDSAGHAWNIVFPDGQPYHIDITFDYSVSEDDIIRYDYFLLSDKQISADHTWSDLPSCDVAEEYYVEQGNLASSGGVLKRLIKDKLTADAPLVVKLPSISGDEEAISEKVMGVIVNAVPLHRSINRSVSLAYNSARMIFRIRLV